MELHRRLSKLEQQAALAGRGQPCAGCGYVPGVTPNVRIIPGGVIKNLTKALAHVQDTSKDFCTVCGRQLMFRIPIPQLARLSGAAS